MGMEAGGQARWWMVHTMVNSVMLQVIPSIDNKCGHIDPGWRGQMTSVMWLDVGFVWWHEYKSEAVKEPWLAQMSGGMLLWTICMNIKLTYAKKHIKPHSAWCDLAWPGVTWCDLVWSDVKPRNEGPDESKCHPLILILIQVRTNPTNLPT